MSELDDEFRWNCPDCDMKYKLEKWYIRHRIAKHGDTTCRRQSDHELPYKCPDCDMEYKLEYWYIKHRKAKHGDEIESEVDDEKETTHDTNDEPNTTEQNHKILKTDGVSCAMNNVEYRPSYHSGIYGKYIIHQALSPSVEYRPSYHSGIYGKYIIPQALSPSEPDSRADEYKTLTDKNDTTDETKEIESDHEVDDEKEITHDASALYIELNINTIIKKLKRITYKPQHKYLKQIATELESEYRKMFGENTSTYRAKLADICRSIINKQITVKQSLAMKNDELQGDDIDLQLKRKQIEKKTNGNSRVITQPYDPFKRRPYRIDDDICDFDCGRIQYFD